MKGFFCAYISGMQRLSFDGMYCTKYRTQMNLPITNIPTIKEKFSHYKPIYRNFVVEQIISFLKIRSN